MNNLDSDLEEGEILDDSPPSPQFNINKRKELPQRYVVKDSKTPSHKHRKSCKHAVRHHAKKLSKMKKSPVKKKSSPKFYHKPSCTYEKSRRVLGRHNSSDNFRHTFPKNGFFSSNPLIDEIKDSLKCAPPHKNFDKPKSQHISHTEVLKTSKKDFAISEISSAKIVKNEVDNSVAVNVSTNFEVAEKTDSGLDLSKNSDDDSIIELDVCEPSPPPLIDLSNSPDNKSTIAKLNSDTDTNNFSNTISNNSLKIEKEEESEDEEELRRIALATCAKRKALKESVTENTSHPSEENNLSDNIQSFHTVISNKTIDNYEVVDMDLDDDMQDSTEIVPISVINETQESAEKLFIIDTNPSCDFLQNKEDSVAEPQIADNSDDEDFQASILRAELINSMYRKKFLNEDPKQSDTITHEKRLHIINQKKFSVSYQKQFSYKRLKSAKHFLRKRSVNKLINTKNNDNSVNYTKNNDNSIINYTKNNDNSINYTKNKDNKAPLPIHVNKPTERLVITVNGESSDDSDEEGNNMPAENPLDSISALISDCRQKSESSKETKEVVPKAVACLSKAQQEEYKNLRRILANKTKLPSPLDDLKKLEKKLFVLRGDLQSKKESMDTLTEEVNSKKLQYMKAKLTAQHLKEQLVAAEKVRKAKLIQWSRTCDNLKLMKQSVTDLENKMNEVQDLCSKLGSSLQGQSYKLPLLSTGSGQS